MVGNLVLRRPRQQIRTYIRRFTSPNAKFGPCSVMVIPTTGADNIFLLNGNKSDISCAYSQHKITCLKEKYILHQIYDAIQLEVALHLQVHYNSIVYYIYTCTFLWETSFAC